VMIEEISFTREKWLFLRISQGMHEMEKCESLCFRAHQNPLCSAFKRVLELGRKEARKEAMLCCKRRTIRRKGLRQLRLCIQHWWVFWSEQNGWLISSHVHEPSRWRMSSLSLKKQYTKNVNGKKGEKIP
jgi:hypothetical protein